MGTDYPFPLGELEPGKLIESMGEFDAETKVCAFYFMILFLNLPDLTVFGFRALWYGIAKDREIVALSIRNGTPLQYSCLENPMDGGSW